MLLKGISSNLHVKSEDDIEWSVNRNQIILSVGGISNIGHRERMHLFQEQFIPDIPCFSTISLSAKLTCGYVSNHAR